MSTVDTPRSPAVPARATASVASVRSLCRGDCPACGRGCCTAITGATIFPFLLVHVLDTALVRVSPQAYNEVIKTYIDAGWSG